MFFKGCVKKACYTYGCLLSQYRIYAQELAPEASQPVWNIIGIALLCEKQIFMPDVFHFDILVAWLGWDSALRALSFVLLPGSGDLHWKLHGKMVQLLRPGSLRWGRMWDEKMMQGQRCLYIWDPWDSVFAPTHLLWRCWKCVISCEALHWNPVATTCWVERWKQWLHGW